MFCPDVGQSMIEEVNIVSIGDNMGWGCMEGMLFFNFSGDCGTTPLVLPIHQYPHVDGNCSVTGGYIYRGTLYPNMQGNYFYGDFCSRSIWSLQEDPQTGKWINSFRPIAPLPISSFGEDEVGEVYMVGPNATSGKIYHLVEIPLTPTPIITETETITQTLTSSETPTLTETVTITFTETFTDTINPIASLTQTFTTTDTTTPNSTTTNTVTPTATPTVTNTLTATTTTTSTRTKSPTATRTSSRTLTATRTHTKTVTPTRNFDVDTNGIVDLRDLALILEELSDNGGPTNLLFDFARTWRIEGTGR